MTINLATAFKVRKRLKKQIADVTTQIYKTEIWFERGSDSLKDSTAKYSKLLADLETLHEAHTQLCILISSVNSESDQYLYPIRDNLNIIAAYNSLINRTENNSYEKEDKERNPVTGEIEITYKDPIFNVEELSLKIKALKKANLNHENNLSKLNSDKVFTLPSDLEKVITSFDLI